MADLSKKLKKKTTFPSKYRRVVSKSKNKTAFSRCDKKIKPRSVTNAITIAKSIVVKREQVLRKLVPGGKCMDECTLLDETFDYVKLLKAQVDVMRLLVNALEVS